MRVLSAAPGNVWEGQGERGAFTNAFSEPGGSIYPSWLLPEPNQGTEGATRECTAQGPVLMASPTPSAPPYASLPLGPSDSRQRRHITQLQLFVQDGPFFPLWSWFATLCLP